MENLDGLVKFDDECKLLSGAKPTISGQEDSLQHQISDDRIDNITDSPLSLSENMTSKCVEPLEDDDNSKILLDTFIVGRKFGGDIELTIGAMVLTEDTSHSKELGFIPRKLAQYFCPWFRMASISYAEICDYGEAVKGISEAECVTSIKPIDKLQIDDLKEVLNVLNVGELRDLLCSLNKLSRIRRLCRSLIMVQESKITLLGFLVHMKVVYGRLFLNFVFLGCHSVPHLNILSCNCFKMSSMLPQPSKYDSRENWELYRISASAESVFWRAEVIFEKFLLCCLTSMKDKTRDRASDMHFHATCLLVMETGPLEAMEGQVIKAYIVWMIAWKNHGDEGQLIEATMWLEVQTWLEVQFMIKERN